MLSKDDNSGVKLEFDNKQTQSAYHKVLSDSQKIQMMRQAISIDVNGYKPFEIFNSFYSEDLIMFGMKNDIPEAVRLGEIMLNENGSSLNSEISKAVKQYKMQNNDRYNKAKSRTGPTDYDKVYRKAQDQAKDGWSENTIISRDDPYWQDFFQRNYRTQDKYKLPSAMAWDYKPNGVFDEIIDFKDLKEKASKIKINI